MYGLRSSAKYAAVLLLSTACLVSGMAVSPAPDAAAASGPPRTVVLPDPAARDEIRPRLFRGRGFDTCTAPALRTMAAWRRSSPYRAVGVYFGGRARGCAQPRLTRSWVRTVHRDGWRVLPLYMGSQPRCVTSGYKRPYRMSARHPARQGRAEGRDAVRRARALGIARRSPLYIDMEHYDRTDRRCAAQVLAFTRAWNRTVRKRGYLAGFYSSGSSGVRDVATAQAAGGRGMPDVMWFANWNGLRTLRDPYLGARQWHPHRRIHQYAGNVVERHGGRSLLIDRNLVDAPVAVIAKRPSNRRSPA